MMPLKKIFFLCCALASAPAIGQWKYSNAKVGIDDVIFKFATVASTESLSLDFPYGGRNLASVTVRINPKGWDVIFDIQKGQLICHQNCQVKIRVDDKTSRLVSMARAADSGVSNMLFVQNAAQAQALARELVGATKLAVELPIYKAMNTVVRFDISGLDLSELGVISMSTPGRAAPAPVTSSGSSDAQRAIGLLSGSPPGQTQPDVRGTDGYYAKVRACVQPRVSFPAPPRGGSGNPSAQYKVSLMSDGQVVDVRLTKSSGNVNFDRAVEIGIRSCTPFPKPQTGGYPEYVDVNYSMYN